jgi:ribosomal protein S18 acetylase RimI-like enzyme
MKKFQIRPLTKDDRAWVAALLKEWWAGPEIVTHGKRHYADKLAGFIAVQQKQRAGLITYNIAGKSCEIVTMNSLVEKIGIGSALINAVRKIALAAGCNKVWLITTNDNTAALRFWQKRGFHITIVRTNTMEEYRKIKPEIPLTGNDGIEIRDEIELEITLKS